MRFFKFKTTEKTEDTRPKALKADIGPVMNTLPKDVVFYMLKNNFWFCSILPYRLINKGFNAIIKHVFKTGDVFNVLLSNEDFLKNNSYQWARYQLFPEVPYNKQKIFVSQTLPEQLSLMSQINRDKYNLYLGSVADNLERYEYKDTVEKIEEVNCHNPYATSLLICSLLCLGLTVAGILTFVLVEYHDDLAIASQVIVGVTMAACALLILFYAAYLTVAKYMGNKENFLETVKENTLAHLEVEDPEGENTSLLLNA